MKDFESIIKALAIRHAEESDALIKQIQDELVHPFCKKYRVRFWSGMGGYNFRTRHGKDIFSYDSPPKVIPRMQRTQAGKELAAIIPILETILPAVNNRCGLGCYMQDYPHTKE
jgi:hypothetical protein